jgi:hypothetical protein
MASVHDSTPAMAHHTLAKLDISYDPENPELSALELLHAIKPDWETAPGKVRIEPLLGGVPNTVCNFT